jgi:CheY-like chemotaxis protein
MLNDQDMIDARQRPATFLRSILIVEEEVVLSVLLEDLVREMGATEVFVHADPDRALQVAAEAQLDCAVLDVHLGGRTSLAVADMLAERGVPFLFSSASRELEIDERHRHRPLLSKPFADADLRQQLLALLRR